MKTWKEEYQRCIEDPIYFIENYIRIIDVEGNQTKVGKLPELLEEYFRRTFNIINNS